MITSGGFTHSIHHPIADPLMAALLEPFVEINWRLLRCGGDAESVAGLKLMQQFFRRTDRHTTESAGSTPGSWHQDQSFLPRHYASAPRSMFYHTILALHDVLRDGAPFFAANHSYRRAKQLSDAMPAAEQQQVVPYADMTRTRLSGHLNELAKSSIPEGAYPHTIASQHQNEIVGNFSLGFVYIRDAVLSSFDGA